MADDYDIGAAFNAIEDELIASMIRNLRRHKNEEVKEDKQWSMWQMEQLRSLENYRRENQKKFKPQFARINKKIDELIRTAKQEGGMEQEIAILKAIKEGFPRQSAKGATAEFFRLNKEKLEALIKATTDDMQKAETAILRMANDQYRKIIFNAQIYANTGAGTYEKAVDMATKDMLAAGLNCVEYKNGARHTLADYADMAIKTASKRAYLQGEGEKRQEWGIATVIMNKRQAPCPKCLPWVGKVLIDDVWSGGSKDGKSTVTGLKYPLMSKAIEKGLYHPRCKDVHSTYFEGISTPPEGSKYTADELDEIAENYWREQKQQYAQHEAKKYDRLAKYSLDKENQEKYQAKADEWKHMQFRTGNMSPQEYAATKEAEFKRNFTDITAAWTEAALPDGREVVELQEITIKDVKYTVDGKHVVLDYSAHEKKVADIISSTYKRTVQMVPRVVYPQNIQTPDYLIDGVGYDLKTPLGNGKYTLYGVVKSKKRQANNFIICLDKTELGMYEIEQQIQGIYASIHTRFIDTILLLRDGKIIKAYKRKK